MDPLRIVYQGTIDGVSSYANVSRGIVASLVKLGHDVKTFGKSNDIWLDEGATLETPGVRSAQAFEEYREAECDAFLRWTYPLRHEMMTGRVNVHILPYEYYQVPACWIERARDPNLHGIVAISDEYRLIFIEAGFPEEKVFAAPLAIDRVRFDPARSEVLRKDRDSLWRKISNGNKPAPTDETTVFLMLGALLDPRGRKRADLAIEAYLRAFSSRDDVMFIIKNTTTHTQFEDYLANEIAKREADSPRIVYHRHVVSDDDLPCYYLLADALVAPSSGEGFGKCVLEASASGAVPVGPAIGGMKDTMTPENSIIVPHRKALMPRPPPYMDGYLPADGNPWFWYEVDAQDLAEALSRIHLDRSALSPLRKAGYSDAGRFSEELTAKRIEDALYELLAINS
ncbi:MAG: glycosyltransferase family 4 protein [Planctomycetes bacterium]|nr:glycosyltransferase family 4 protein [Planctomycetota bacterium]